jgi:hypothetical protein
MFTNNKWGALSMRDRAFLIREAVRNGITDINSIRDTWEHRFDGESSQPIEEKPWYKKVAEAISEGSRMARDARIGAIGAEPIRQLYAEGETEKAQELSKQYAKANVAGITYATGKAIPNIIGSIVPVLGAVGADVIIEDAYRNSNLPFSSIKEISIKKKQPSSKKEQALLDINQRLERVENSKTKKGGWNEAEKVWYPHTSWEGGNSTIGYGLKLNKGTDAYNLVKKQGYITEEQERRLRYQDTDARYEKSKKTYDDIYGYGEFDNLSYKAQSLLTDKEYNVRKGLKSFPKLMEAFYEEDLDAIRENIITKASKKGSKKMRRLGRNDDFLKDLDSIDMGFYSIKRK